MMLRSMQYFLPMTLKLTLSPEVTDILLLQDPSSVFIRYIVWGPITPVTCTSFPTKGQLLKCPPKNCPNFLRKISLWTHRIAVDYIGLRFSLSFYKFVHVFCLMKGSQADIYTEWYRLYKLIFPVQKTVIVVIVCMPICCIIINVKCLTFTTLL